MSGAFVPVSEDQGMIDAVAAGALTLAKLEAMATVYSVSLDGIAVPGDTSAATLRGLIADERTIGMVNHKTTAVRVIPIPGRGPGEKHDCGGLLGTAIVQDPGTFSCEVLWRRGRASSGADGGQQEQRPVLPLVAWGAARKPRRAGVYDFWGFCGGTCLQFRRPT